MRCHVRWVGRCVSATKLFLDVFSELRQHELHARLGVLTAIMTIHCQTHKTQYQLMTMYSMSKYGSRQSNQYYDTHIQSTTSYKASIIIVIVIVSDNIMSIFFIIISPGRYCDP